MMPHRERIDVKPKTVITMVLLIFVIVSIAYLTMNEYRGRRSTGVSAIAVPGPGTAPRKVVAYYFHGRIRCESCRLIEGYSHQAIQKGFPKELEDGRLEWRVVNVQDPGNEHFMQDYGLSFWSLVLVELRDGQQQRWKNCEKVWELLDNPDAFTDYVSREVRAFLEEKQG